MKNLRDILYKVGIEEVVGSTDLSVQSLVFDSRKVQEGDVFIALSGTQVDGHDFVGKAIALGATAVICERLPEEIQDGVTFIRVDNSAAALGYMASNYFDNPSADLKLVGVTGTNGKTTTVTLLHELFLKLGYVAGLLSTVVNKVGEKEIPSTHTTPDAVQLNELLRQMVDEGCSHCFMEVSSHAVVQERITGLTFAGGAFTNISHDHLDYHKTFDAYIAAKRAFFNKIPTKGFALANKDDKRGTVMLQETDAKKYYYAVKKPADFKTKVIESNFLGLNLKVDGEEVWSPLIGYFNAYNITTVYAVAQLLGEDKIEVLTAISTLEAVAGRFQYIRLNEISGIVDYAHTPDALENVLTTIKEIRTGNEQVITVVGCGGDRDKEKRPIMAGIAAKYSDRVFLTSDNPRSENPDSIINDMKKGVDAVSRKKTLSITDRKEAIRAACSMADAADIILIAGKGHETYQEINGERFPFDDLQVLQEALNELKTN